MLTRRLTGPNPLGSRKGKARQNDLEENGGGGGMVDRGGVITKQRLLL